MVAKLKVDQLETVDGTGIITANNQLTAPSFAGDGSSLTGIQSPLIEGTDYLAPDGDGSSLTGVGVADGDVTMAKLSTSGTEGDNVENIVGKVWVQFNGTGTVAIQSDFNVSSVGDTSTGQYVVNFSTAMADNDYAALHGGIGYGYGGGSRVNDIYTSSCGIDCFNNSSYKDSGIVTFLIMGNSA